MAASGIAHASDGHLEIDVSEEVRVSIEDADALYGRIPVGTPVLVYD